MRQHSKKKTHFRITHNSLKDTLFITIGNSISKKYQSSFNFKHGIQEDTSYVKNSIKTMKEIQQFQTECFTKFDINAQASRR